MVPPPPGWGGGSTTRRVLRCCHDTACWKISRRSIFHRTLESVVPPPEQTNQPASVPWRDKENQFIKFTRCCVSQLAVLFRGRSDGESYQNEVKQIETEITNRTQLLIVRTKTSFFDAHKIWIRMKRRNFMQLCFWNFQSCRDCSTHSCICRSARLWKKRPRPLDNAPSGSRCTATWLPADPRVGPLVPSRPRGPVTSPWVCWCPLWRTVDTRGP